MRASKSASIIEYADKDLPEKRPGCLKRYDDDKTSCKRRAYKTFDDSHDLGIAIYAVVYRRTSTRRAVAMDYSRNQVKMTETKQAI